MRKKRGRRKLGDVVSIPLGDGQHGFGRVLEEPLMAFYDIRSDAQPPIEEIISQPVLFRIWVMKYAVTSGRWPVIGHAPVEEELLEMPAFFMWDFSFEKLYITYDGSQRIPATSVQCEGLEEATVWFPEHVEARLRCHFAGRRSK